jgi:hypothetical protein
MTAATDKDWVIPAHIPFEKLKKKDLEECVYWLLDGMGARDLAWRKGGTGHGASDGISKPSSTFRTIRAKSSRNFGGSCAREAKELSTPRR